MDTIKQKTVVVQIDGGQPIEVRRMLWKPTKEFLRKLGEVVTKVARDARPDADRTTIRLTLDSVLNQLPALIDSSDELITILITRSSSVTAEQLDGFDNLVALALLNAALEVNFDQELKNFSGGIVEKIGAILPAAKAAPATTT